MDHRPPAPAPSAEPADWIAPRLTGAWGHLTGIVPSGFAAYARIFHPADEGSGTPTTWAEMAAANGRTLHPSAQWERIRTPAPGRVVDEVLMHVDAPSTGELPVRCLSALLGVLARHTPAPERCWFGVWDGYGWLRGHWGSVTSYSGTGPRRPAAEAPVAWQLDPTAPTFTHPGRDYHLYSGALADASRIGHWATADWFLPQSPNLFWPDDRTWCVASEIDFDSTLVGGSTELIADVCAGSGLEALPIDPDASFQWDADTVNQP